MTASPPEAPRRAQQRAALAQGLQPGELNGIATTEGETQRPIHREKQFLTTQKAVVFLQQELPLQNLQEH